MLCVCSSFRSNEIHSKKRIYYVSFTLLIICTFLIFSYSQNGPLMSDVPDNHSRRLRLQKDHKRLFPIHSSDKWGLVSASLAVMIAAGGGIGGGGMLVPIYILVMGFTAKYAIPLSNVTVFGGALGNTAVNWKKRHPLADRPLIDWDLILIMEPLTIGGALIGSLLNKILPESVIVIMLVVLLTFIAYTTLAKAFSMYDEESESVRKPFQPIHDIQISNPEHSSRVDKQAASMDSALSGSFQNSDINSDLCEILKYDEKISELSDLMATSSSGSNSSRAELLEILKDERKTPLKKVAFITGLFLLILVINILKGGGSKESPNSESCSTLGFWLANTFMLLCIIIFFFFSRSHLTHEYRVKKKHRYNYVEGDIEWSEQATIIYPFLCCFAGFFSGMFGIGGGIVKGPLMLQMGVNPAVVSASCSTMILYTCFTATVSYATFGLLQWDYAIVCAVLGLTSSLVGQYAVGYLLKRYGRHSFIAFSVGGAVLFSAILMTVESIFSIEEGTNG